VGVFQWEGIRLCHQEDGVFKSQLQMGKVKLSWMNQNLNVIIN
jgi:hypothetical protein